LKPPSSPSPSQPGGGKQAKISETVPKPDIPAAIIPDPPANVTAEPSVATEQETSQPKPVAKQPLSPYTA